MEDGLAEATQQQPRRSMQLYGVWGGYLYGRHWGRQAAPTPAHATCQAVAERGCAQVRRSGPMAHHTTATATRTRKSKRAASVTLVLSLQL
jgi:hypothetical protein